MQNTCTWRPLRISGFVSFAMGTFLYLTSPAYSMNITLQWDANSEPDPRGYMIYYGAESGPPYQGSGLREGPSPIKVSRCEDENPDPDIVEYMVHDVPDGTYYFAVTAYSGGDFPLESNYSKEISINPSNGSGEEGNITYAGGSGSGG